MIDIAPYARDLPDVDACRRFVEQLGAEHPERARKLTSSPPLTSDVLTLVSFSPLIAATLLRSPEYIQWLDRERVNTSVRSKEDLVESLARFALTHSSLEPHVLYSRFRRRELIRIFLRDVRRLATIAEITEELSNLADAILETALRAASQKLENRFGTPLVIDDRGKKSTAEFTIVALGKLGSRELNYSSDIDLIYLYSGNGSTSSGGTDTPITNREYFSKLAGAVTKLVGEQSGEGAAYRVDLRLRPHGRLGPVTQTAEEAARYYRTEAHTWERQTLIRSRASAGSERVFGNFFAMVETSVYRESETIADALSSVRRSKERIDEVRSGSAGIDVKLGRGGIREIEFIAQALQLAHGGTDRWLRAPHTLISLSRLSDRGLMTEVELTELFEAYDLLRRIEHLLQMESGLQTHTVPDDAPRQEQIALRAGLSGAEELRDLLQRRMNAVNAIFCRVFAEGAERDGDTKELPRGPDGPDDFRLDPHLAASIGRSGRDVAIDRATLDTLGMLGRVSPNFTAMLAANPALIRGLPDLSRPAEKLDYRATLEDAVGNTAGTLREQMGALRRAWSEALMAIAVYDAADLIDIAETRRRQTELAEASIDVGLDIARSNLAHSGESLNSRNALAVLGLGKLGAASVDYGSDLDLLIVVEAPEVDTDRASADSRLVRSFVNVLSGMTREGQMYRIDLRLRPFGTNGLPATPRTAFIHYLETSSEVWEWLAYVNLRAAGGDSTLGAHVESDTSDTIYGLAAKMDRVRFLSEAREMRLRLERQRSARIRGGDIDIKFGAGGLLDVYFIARTLRLATGRRPARDRSTSAALAELRAAGTLSEEQFTLLSGGYEFLSRLDHHIRLSIGRSSTLPAGRPDVMSVIARRMALSGIPELAEQLTVHRLNIRASFDELLPG